MQRWSLYAGSITRKVYSWGPVKCGLYKQVVFRTGLNVFDYQVDNFPAVVQRLHLVHTTGYVITCIWMLYLQSQHMSGFISIRVGQI